jgi:hypothetical protein
MTFSEETLMAYADNELDPQTRSAVEAAMTTDPDIARRVAQHKALRGKLRATFDKVLHEPPPQRLMDTARGVPPVRREGNVIPLRRKQPQRRGLPQWASLAATLVIGVIIGHALLRLPLGGGDPPVTSRNGQVLANGTLAQALSDQLASTQTADTPVKIGVTFKSKAGAYCRTFTLHESAALAGLACRDHDDWRVQMLAQSAQAPAPAGAETNSTSTAYRQAGSQIPHSILQAVEDNIAGDPLDAHAEAQAREQHWTAP